MSDHDRLQELLAVYRDLDEETRQRVDEHVATCDACARDLADYRAMDRDLAALDDPKPEPWLRDAFYVDVGRADVDETGGSWVYHLPTVLSATAAAVAVIALVGVLWALFGSAADGEFALQQNGTPVVSVAATATRSADLPSSTTEATPHPTAVATTPTPPPAGSTERITSPDGRWTAINDTTAGSLVLEGPSGDTVMLFEAGSTVRGVEWSPDGRYLLAVQTNWGANEDNMPEVYGALALWRVPVRDDGVGEPERVFRSPSEPLETGELPPEHVRFGDWSPDGRYLLFWYGMSSASVEAGGLPVVVLDVETGEVTPIGDAALVNPRYHSWAPDSSTLAITTGGYRSAQDNKWLNLVDPASGEITTVVSETEQIPGIVAWSPRGDVIAYAAAPAEARTGDDNCCPITFENPAIAARRIYLLDPETGENRRLNDIEAYQDAPSWSEDGETLYYVQREDDTVVLVAADPTTGEVAPIEASRQPLPDLVGYYGQAEWEDVEAFKQEHEEPTSDDDPSVPVPPGELHRLVTVDHDPPSDARMDEPVLLTFDITTNTMLCAIEVCSVSIYRDGGTPVPMTREIRDEHLIVTGTVSVQNLTDPGLSYYLEITDPESGRSVRYPRERGSIAVSLEPVPATIALPAWDEVPTAGETVLRVPWGDGPEQVGRDGRTAPTAFDVGPEGTIVLLDPAHERVLIADDGAFDSVPLPSATVSDVDIDANGYLTLLDPVGEYDARAGRTLAQYYRLEPSGDLVAQTPIHTRQPTHTPAALRDDLGVLIRSGQAAYVVWPVTPGGDPRPAEAQRNDSMSAPYSVDAGSDAGIRVTHTPSGRTITLETEGAVPYVDSTRGDLVVVLQDSSHFRIIRIGGANTVLDDVRVPEQHDSLDAVNPYGRVAVDDDGNVYVLNATGQGIEIVRVAEP